MLTPNTESDDSCIHGRGEALFLLILIQADTEKKDGIHVKKVNQEHKDMNQDYGISEDPLFSAFICCLPVWQR